MVMGTGIRDIYTVSEELHSNQFISDDGLVNPIPLTIQNFIEEPSVDDSDIALNYINQMLNDEDEEICSFHEYSALVSTEKPFYEILQEKYLPCPVVDTLGDSNLISESPDVFSSHYVNSSSVTCGGSSSNSSGSSGGGTLGNNWPNEYSACQLPIEFNSFGNLECSSDYGLLGISNLFPDSLPAWHFQKGVEEAQKFLPSNDKLVISSEANYGSRVRKNPHDDELRSSEEGRSVKQLAVSSEDALRSEIFDEVLLCHGGNDLCEELQQALKGKGRHEKKQPKKEVVDLRSLLIQCAQMVALYHQRQANELLKQIRQHSSPTGDGSQRMAYYLADALEARLAGTGSEIYNSYRAGRRTATDFLKAHRLCLAACPFRKVSHFFSNETILNVSEKATRIHVVDFGINYGFQWPSLLQRMSARPGGPPKLRITGIDYPLPGLRPAQCIEETGCRLADYAKSFNVPFEYKSIASKWEEVHVEDLEIDRDEMLVVNCLYQLRYLADETVALDSPRNKVLRTIRKTNPDGSYNASFFMTRFREALYHFSSLYDMLDTNAPREDVPRILVEREIFGGEAINAIACEGLERMERPETYKQWTVRNLKAGFMQHPLNRDMLKEARDKVKIFYHKDFNVDEDGQWLLQGWKGRILFALSSWKPNNLS